MDTQSLSAVIQIQRLVAAQRLDVNELIHRIAQHTRNVANAAGVAIGLLEGHHLVYRAGIGTAAAFVGRHVTATLSVGADSKGSREILRVENAQADPRIEAAICRQFGAESLLIIPIYRAQTVTGVLEVMFGEAHTFQDREVRAYRLMAGLVGDALLAVAAASAKAEEKVVAAVTPASLVQVEPKIRAIPSRPVLAAERENRLAIYEIWEAALAIAGNMAFVRLPGVAAKFTNRLRRLPFGVPQWTAVTAAVIALLVVGWSAYGGRVSVSSDGLHTTNALDQPSAVAPTPPARADADPVLTSASMSLPKAAPPTFRRVRVNENEIDDIAADVTVRHFVQKPTLQHPSSEYNQVEFGKDVTVRYFASNRGVSSTQVGGSGIQPVNQNLGKAPAKVVQ